MKKKDIDVAQVYARRDGLRVSEVRFMAPLDKLYKVNHYGRDDGPRFLPGDYPAPRKDSIGVITAGYLVAEGHSTQTASLEEAQDRAKNDGTLPYRYHLLTSLRGIDGPLQTVKAQIEADNRERLAWQERNKEKTARMIALRDRLQGLGVLAELMAGTGPWYGSNTTYPPTGFRLAEKDARQLAELLENKSPRDGDDRKGTE